MSHECTTKDCLNHTSTYLCTQCVRDLQAWLDKIPVLIATLSVTIAKLDHVRPANAGWNAGGKPGSAAPLNLDALQLQENLKTVWPDAKEYAKDSRAAGLAELIQEWVTGAELLVSGPEAEIVDHAAAKARLKDANLEPMPTRQLLPWLRENAGVRLVSQRIRDWVRDGHLRPHQHDGGQPAYHPAEVIDVWQRIGRK
ncbi:helix-turn-helix DNA-binding domain protein [Arthrobacter phage Kumotta]|uniref:Helix-turn-helix DNA-binding domain protein n=1 Tax=Arthrobacter phage Kumotta TaxID=2588498 RepID=A0A4Y6ELJ3_9CAUD|nr:helix-turn-helix DNA-binding domain protein [Arthrobacter phage Kumotta]QDF19583.1 helix-turn-helix DNA-binding domain protein [Arthrobacter phage Kumotta]